MAGEEAREAELVSQDGAEDDGVSQLWADCNVTHDELRREAFEVRSTAAEQSVVLKEMFDDDWHDEDEAAIAETELAV